MKTLFSKFPWRRQLPALIPFTISFIALLITVWLHLNHQESLKNAQIALRQQQSINASASESKRILETFQDPYYDLVKRGVIGEERRLQWLESLQLASEENRLPRVSFNIASTEPTDQSLFSYWRADTSVSATPMTLRMTLRHEGDLARFFTDLSHKAEGLFSIDLCEIQQKLGGENSDPAMTGQEAHCTITWFTFTDITQQWEEEGL